MFRTFLAVFLISAVVFTLVVLPGVGVGRAAARRLTAVPPGEITGLVWHDYDLDLFPDADEPPLPGVTVILQNENRAFLSSTTTDAEGHYTFSGLGMITYWVVEIDPPGFISTTANEVRVELIGNQGAEVNFGDTLPVTDTPTPAGSPVTLQLAVRASRDDTYVTTDLGNNNVAAAVVRRPCSRQHRTGRPALPADRDSPWARSSKRLRLHVAGHGGGLPVGFVIMGEAADAAVDFRSSNPLARCGRTQAAVDWLLPAWPDGWIDSPNLSGPLQEIVDRPGWAAGNPLVLLVLAAEQHRLSGRRRGTATRPLPPSCTSPFARRPVGPRPRRRPPRPPAPPEALPAVCRVSSLAARLVLTQALTAARIWPGCAPQPKYIFDTNQRAVPGHRAARKAGGRL
ncbi:MAG: carboxypeptidase regulatory-like domain-containing protein [Anaerolineae bacterium]|nr:MAG: carboxypeptidase regulatory-like domain-containing protein [Anaerolineae bacterium]